MKILVFNANNLCIRFYLYEMDDSSLIASGYFDRIGLDDSNYSITYQSEVVKENIVLTDYFETVRILFDKIVDLGIVSSLDAIKGISHRILHGGSLYNDSVWVDDKVLSNLDTIEDYAPFYNHGAVMTIKACMKLLPDSNMGCVFDTAFHQTMSEENYLYPIPYKWYRDYGVRKYGFHGLSHKDVALQLKELLGREDIDIISCHIDSDGSICAISNMKCVDTSMGFSPISGIMMENCSGDIDPSIIPYVMVKEGKNAAEILDDLNYSSGLLGLSEYSSDINDIYNNLDSVDKKVVISKNKFVRRIVDFIAKYYVLLNKASVITFSGEVLLNNVSLRREICEKLACLGVKIDLDINNKINEFIKISTDESLIDVYVVPTDENLMVAKEMLILMNR